MRARLNSLLARELPLNRAIISDIALWVLLAALLAFAVYFWSVRLPERHSQSITLHFRDANEITQGSSLRMMGMEVGYVSDLRIHQDHVDVVLRTYPNALPIPSGSVFTVLFTGLAGGKSIEVQLPEHPQPTRNGQPIYLVEEPIRMKDTMNSTIDVTQALQKGAENIADFFGKKKPVEELQFNIRQSHQWSQISLSYTDDVEADLRTLQHQVVESTFNGLDAMSGLKQQTRHAEAMTHPKRLHPSMRAFFDNVQAFNRMMQAEAHGTADTSRMMGQMAQVNAVNSQVSHWVQASDQTVRNFPVSTSVARAEQAVSGLSTFADRTDAVFGTQTGAISVRSFSSLNGAGDARRQSLEHTRRVLQRFNHQLEDWNGQVDTTQHSRLNQPSSQRSAATHRPALQTASTDHSKPLILADRNGNPLDATQARWWDQSTTPQGKIMAAQSGPAPQTPPTSFLARIGTWMSRIVEAVGSLFR